MALSREQILSCVPKLSPINGLYTNVSAIGENGGTGYFSVVFQCTEIATQRQVALKFFVDRGDPYRRACFDREARVLNTTFRDEPLFVQALGPQEILKFRLPSDVGEIVLDLPYIAFEWVPNGNVERFCVPPVEIHQFERRLQLFRRMCRCVSRMHYLECSHRDLKPGNFFVAQHDEIKLGDFGTVKLFAPTEQPLLQSYNSAVGDRRYASPETLASLSITPVMGQKADVYALGAVFFEMMTGQALYLFTLRSVPQLLAFSASMQTVPERSREDIFCKFIEATKWEVPPVRTLNPEIPKCIHKQVDDIIHELTRIDYRERRFTLTHIHRMTRICELLLKQERRRKERRSRPEPSKGVVSNA